MNIGDVYRGNHNRQLIAIIISENEASLHWPNGQSEQVDLEYHSLEDGYTKLYSGNGSEIQYKVRVRIGDVYKDQGGTYLVAGPSRIIHLERRERLVCTTPKNMVALERIVQGEGAVVGEYSK